MAVALSFIAGVAVHAPVERPWLSPSAVHPFMLLSVGAMVLASVRRTPAPFILLLCLSSLTGFARFDAALGSVVAAVPDHGGTFTGVVASPPERKTAYTVLTVGKVVVTGTGRVFGRVRLTLPPYGTYVHGDVIRWYCESPQEAGIDRRAHLLFIKGASWGCRPRTAPVIVGHDRRLLVSVLHEIRRKLIGRLSAMFPEPEASFMSGLLIGQDDGLPPDLIAAFRATGTSHVLAVSGYNVAQLIKVVVWIGAFAGVNRRISSRLAAAVVVAFSIVVGNDASVVRAAIMGCTGILAVAWRRRYGGGRALVVAAAVMLFANPFVLRHDVGFRLSFSAVLGLQVLAPPIERWLIGRLRLGSLSRIIAETTAAVIATAPFVLSAFGTIPLVAPLANLIILPFIPLAMTSGMLAVVLSSVHQSVALPFTLLAALLLRGIVGVVRLLAEALPFSVTASGAAETVAASAPFVAAMAVLCLKRFRIPRDKYAETARP